MPSIFGELCQIRSLGWSDNLHQTPCHASFQNYSLNRDGAPLSMKPEHCITGMSICSLMSLTVISQMQK